MVKTKIEKMNKNEQPYIQMTEALIKVGNFIVSSSSFEEMLNNIVKTIAQASGAKICLLMFYDEIKKEQALKASYGLNVECLTAVELAIGKNINDAVAKEKKPVIVSNVLEDSRFANSEIIRKEKLCTLLALPLLMKDKVQGMIMLYNERVKKYSQNELNILQVLANQSMLVIENSNLLKRAVDAEEALEARKLIERAKGILVKTQGMDEDDAYRTIHRKSMDMRRSMKEIAEAIILSNEIRRK